MSKTRRWEKPAPSGAPAQNQSPLSSITSFVDSLNADERASHRAAYLHLMQALTGASVNVDHVDNAKLSGVLHAITPFDPEKHCVVLKGCKVQREASTGPSANDGKTAILNFAKVATIQNAGKLDLVTRNYSTEFATDSSIKKHGDMSHLSGRDLKSVDNSWLVAAGDMSLEGKSNSGKSWDQFEANRRLFNVKDTYDENLYTKKLDLKSMTSEQIAKADRLAREIEGTVSTNIHLQEERGQAPEGDWDEEDRFSGVLKEAPAVKKAPAESSNPWKRGTKLGATAAAAASTSGASSPATPATLSNSTSATNISAKAPLTPPPGVPPPGAGKKSAPAAEAAAPKAKGEKVDKGDEPVAKVAEKAADKVAEKKTEPATTPVETSASASTVPADKPVDKPVDAVVAEVKPTKKLNAAAAEFKPSWMTGAASTPAPAPATPVAPSTPQQPAYAPPAVAQNYTPNHNFNNSPQPMHSPNFVQHVPADAGYQFDPNAVPINMLPPGQFGMPNSPPYIDQNTGNFFLPQQIPMMMGGPSMDYLPQQLMMQGMPPMVMQGMPQGYPPMQGVPMHDGNMYMQQPGMHFQPAMNMNMNMGMMQPNQQMNMGYPPQQGGYNNNGNMGSGQKPKFNNNNGDMRNKGGRGMGGRGYNNNGGRGGYGNSPQHGGMPPPSGPGNEGAPDSA